MANLFSTSIFLLLIVILISCVSWGQTSPQNAGLNSHNQFRVKHRVGPHELDGDLNSEAERCAVIYATNQKIDHSCATPGAGENLFMMWGTQTTPDPTDITVTAVKSWYDEHISYNYANPESSTGMTGHFTQLVWKESTLLGIGVATVNTHTVVVGKYKPPGNVILVDNSLQDNYTFYKANVFPPVM